jgi:lysophospholipase L1-like esterase
MTNLLLLAFVASAQADYVEPMRKVAAEFKGREGVVIHVGDSITYANQYSAWARHGKGKTPEEVALATWMHTGKDDDSDGFWLCRVDRPGGRSETAVSGIRSHEWLEGGKAGVAPLAEVVKRYRPQVAVVMLGTNDVGAGRSPAQVKADMGKIVDLLLAQKAIPILSTIPPFKGKEEAVKAVNAALLQLRQERRIPLIDYHAEILKRRPADWLGTLISDDGVHPSGSRAGTDAAAEPSEENLGNSGYLLRSVLSVRKILEVKSKVLDARKR